jgi:hypothetical protein
MKIPFVLTHTYCELPAAIAKAKNIPRRLVGLFPSTNISIMKEEWRGGSCDLIVLVRMRRGIRQTVSAVMHVYEQSVTMSINLPFLLWAFARERIVKDVRALVAGIMKAPGIPQKPIEAILPPPGQEELRRLLSLNDADLLGEIAEGQFAQKQAMEWANRMRETMSPTEALAFKAYVIKRITAAVRLSCLELEFRAVEKIGT